MYKNKLKNVWITNREIQHDKQFHIGESQPAKNSKATESENLKNKPRTLSSYSDTYCFGWTVIDKRRKSKAAQAILYV